jgi:hypothetical protein
MESTSNIPTPQVDERPSKVRCSLSMHKLLNNFRVNEYPCFAFLFLPLQAPVRSKRLRRAACSCVTASLRNIFNITFANSYTLEMCAVFECFSAVRARRDVVSCNAARREVVK